MATRSEWNAWPVSWSAVWVGALTALAVGLIIGLLGFALGSFSSASGIEAVSPLTSHLSPLTSR